MPDFKMPLKMNQLEITNPRAHQVAGNPGSPVAGQWWYNSSTGKFMWRDGSTNIDPLARANHSGTQLASTVSDFDTQVRTSRLDQMAAPTASVSWNSQKITSLADPTSAQDAATMAYVLSQITRQSYKIAVRAATAAALPTNSRSGNVLTASANGAFAAVDGVTIAVGDTNVRVLVQNEATGANNGIYDLTTTGTGGTPWVLTRSSDADASAEVKAGMTVVTQEGTTNGDKQFTLTTNDPITLNTTALVFALTSAGGSSYLAGNGLTLTGSTFSVVADTGIAVTGSGVKVDTAVVVRKFAATIGDGSTTAIVVTHSLGTRDVTVSVHDAATFAEIGCDIEKTTTNTITATFAVAPASNAYRVTVHG